MAAKNYIMNPAVALLGTVSPAYGAPNRHSCHRLRRWLCSKHKAKGG